MFSLACTSARYQFTFLADFLQICRILAEFRPRTHAVVDLLRPMENMSPLFLVAYLEQPREAPRPVLLLGRLHRRARPPALQLVQSPFRGPWGDYKAPLSCMRVLRRSTPKRSSCIIRIGQSRSCAPLRSKR